ncbi:MAG: alginate export family protein [Candidatus Azobacteroides sp.]|nr:alginate export family protein [Candidatus Azobacteroides sp.]
MKKLLFIVSISLLSVTHAFGQAIKVDAEVRSRGEYRDGFREPLADTLNPVYVNNLRTKLNIAYASSDVKAKVSLLDTRTLGGTEPGRTGSGIGVLEAWGEYNFTPEFSFSIGRQGLEYDDKRLFSYNNWSNTPAAHDIAMLKYNGSGLSVHFGTAYNNASDALYQSITPYTMTYRTLNFIRAEKNFGLLSASALWVNDGYQSGSENDVTTTYRNTVGGNLWLTNKKNPFTFLASGYYQFGHDRSNKKLSSYLLAINAQQTWAGRYSLQIGGDLYSGSAYDIDAKKSNTFNKLYGSNHSFNGSMEYWSTLPNQGLFDFFAGATAKGSSKFDINLTYHYFATARAMNADGDKGLGSEIDLTANYTVNELLAVQGGWSFYFKNNGTDIVKSKTGIDTRFPQWIYLQLTFKPVFFNKK